MSLDYAAGHLVDALRSLAKSEQSLPDRLQTVWDKDVQQIWMKPCLTRELLQDFRDLWQRYTAASDDRRSTKLRTLTAQEEVAAIDELIALAIGVLRVSNTQADPPLATLADLR